MRTTLLATLVCIVPALVGCQPPVVDAHFSPVVVRDSEPAAPGTLVVQGTATLEVNPDIADIRLDLSTLAASPSAAVAKLRQHEAQLRSKLDGAGMKLTDVRVSTITLNPEHQWDAARAFNVLTGYRATLSVTACTDEFNAIPAVIEAAAEAGVTTVATNFRSTKMPELKAEVRAMALDAAKAKADQFKGALDLTISRVIHVAEAQAGTAWSTYAVGNAFENAVASDPSAGAVNPQAQPLTLTVDITYELG